MASSNASTFQVQVKNVSIDTTVADTVQLVDSSIEHLRTLLASKPKKVVGLDCEWRPNVKYWQRRNKVSTLQLCSENHCVIIQLFYLNSIPYSLRSFLSDPEFIFVGVRVEEDAQKLRLDYGISVHRTIDIVELAVSKGFGKALMYKSTLGLKDLAREVAHITLDKSKYLSMSDWQVRKLSIEQIRYACLDAYASYAIGRKLLIEA